LPASPPPLFQIEAVLANQPGNPVLVGAPQQLRGGNVTNILPGQMAQILQGSRRAGCGTNVVPPPPVVVTGAPILPGNTPITAPPMPRPVTSSPLQHHNRPDGCDRGNLARLGQ
jgi:hypothetical protein